MTLNKNLDGARFFGGRFMEVVFFH